MGVTWLVFAAEFAGLSWPRNRRNIVLLSIIPIISIFILWTNPLHHWFWTNIYPSPGTNGAILVWQPGSWYWIQGIYEYTLIFAGFLVLWNIRTKRSKLFQRQVVAILLGILAPIAGNIIYILGYSPIKGLDLTPFGFVITGAICIFTIFRFRFPGIIPIARSKLIEELPDGVVSLDMDERLLDLNPAFEAIAGVKAELALGKHLNLVWPKLYQLVSELNVSKQTNLTTDISDSNRYFNVSMTPLYDGDNSQVGELIVIRDVTTERLLRINLQEEIDKRNRYNTALVHELKTPLTAVLASSELLEEELHNETLLALVRNVRRASSNLEKRINELLELSKGEAGLLRIETNPLDIKQFMQDVVNEMAPVALKQGLILTSDISGTIPQVLADRDRLQQVLSNLLSNAIKFTNQGKISIKASEYNSDSVLVQIEDTGKGIEKEQLETLFDPYQRGKPDNRLSGLGVGLALSKMIIELHGGKIWAESSPGKGSIFSFTLPTISV